MNWEKLKNDLIKSKYHYYHTDNGVLLNGNSIDILKELPNDIVDLVVTDPPYNIADKSKLTKVGDKVKSNDDAWGGQFKDRWDSIDEYYEMLLNPVSTLLKQKLNENGSLVMFLNREYTGYYIYKLTNDLNFIFKNKLYFEKSNPIPHIRKNNYRSCIEEAIWLTKSKKYNINFISQADMKQIFKGNIGRKKTKHPTEKYVWMIKPIIERHSSENDIVLDPFLGSGTTAELCESLNRKWIGIELNTEYCEIIKQRIINEVCGKLF